MCRDSPFKYFMILSPKGRSQFLHAGVALSDITPFSYVNAPSTRRERAPKFHDATRRTDRPGQRE
jgi:hypothetical protein